MKSGSVVPAAAEGSNSHLHPAHTTHQQMPAAALFPPNVEAALVTSQYPVFSSARSHGAAAAKTWEPAAEYLVQWKGGGAEGRQGYWLLLKAANEISWNTVFGKCIKPSHC